MMKNEEILNLAKETFDIEAQAIISLKDKLDEGQGNNYRHG
jgi:hypothetical protein